MEKERKNSEKETKFFEPDGVMPLYLQLKNKLKERLLSMPELERLPGTLELAEEYRVSKGTVNRALKLLVEENLICRIPHRGTLRCSAQDYADPQLNSRVFGLVFPAAGYQSWKEMIVPMQKHAELAGFSLDIYLYTIAPSNLESTLKRARKHCAGIALYLASDRENPLTEIMQDNFPTVVIGQKFEGLPLSTVTADNYTAARRITRYFFDKGRRSVALVFGPFKDATFTRSRLEGWKEAHKEAGIPVDMGKVFYPEDEESSGFDRFLERAHPDAFILSNNGQDWRNITNYLRKIQYPAADFAAFILPNDEDKSCFTEDTVFAEMPAAESAAAVIRLLVMMMQKTLKTSQKIEIGLDIYLKKNRKR